MVVALWVRRVVVLWRGGGVARPLAVPAPVWAVGLGVVVAFTVARNLPGSWLAA